MAGLAALLGPEIVERELKIRGQVARFHFRELSGDEMDVIYAACRDAAGKVPPEKNRELRNRIIAASLCDAHGAPVMSIEQVGAQRASLHIQLQAAAFELTGMSGKEESAEKNA
ncbi:MAG: hypothetical protein ACREUF_10050 [Solimonas sp.]